jgi:DNA-directed RNA polymerase subunit RPC12/RpoP
MTLSWFLFSMFVPPAAAILVWFFIRGKDLDPAVIVVLNGLMPGSGLAAADRSVLEVALGTVMAQVSCFVVGGPEIGLLAPIGVIGAIWGLLYTPWNPLTAQGRPNEVVRTAQTTPPSNRPSPRDTVGGMAKLGSQNEKVEVTEGYSVAVRCTECGADIDVPVLHRAAQCSFCGSHHLVVGHDDLLQVAIPSKITDAPSLRDAVLDHLRYRHYLKLYERFVAPLERQATEAGPTGAMAVRADVEAASAAAEQAITIKADAYRAKIEKTLEIRDSLHFLAPYYHSMGTLFQAAFGRDPRTQDKCLLFTMASLESALSAQEAVELPPMGKLSYLKSLVSAAQLGADVQTMHPDLDSDDIAQAYGDLDRKQLNRSIRTIKLGSSFAEEVRAVVWRPWWIAKISEGNTDESLLIDGASGSVSGAAPFVNPETLQDLPETAREPGATLRFQPMECPTCGHEFRYEADAVLHFCINCHRLFKAHAEGKTEIDYDRAAASSDDAIDIVPFWRFPLQLKTAGGLVITDMRHLRDGIDGTMDQIGDDTPQGQDFIWVPAIRCINPRLMTSAFNRLFMHVSRHPPRVVRGRYPLDENSIPWPVNLDEDDVRHFAPLYLANAFGRRDIARVNVHHVGPWLFESKLISSGRLTYLPIPRSETETFRAYVGRYQGGALASAQGTRS